MTPERYIWYSKVRENPSGDFKAMYRHISKGAWTFSMHDHGWQVSDSTAEGLKVHPNSIKLTCKCLFDCSKYAWQHMYI